MLQIDVQSPDRVGALLLVDELGGEATEKATGPSTYSIWCDVDEATLRKRLAKICHHPFTVQRKQD
jgi:hypothetical protein